MRSRLPMPALLSLLALVVSAVVNPGNFGSVDTTHRLQAERWIRLGEPPVRPIDIEAGFGVRGRNGVMYPWFGVGQSLVMLPFDVLVSGAVTPFLKHGGLNAEKQRQVEELLIAFLMQAMLTWAMLLLARALLQSFGFDCFAATAGAVSLLFATTCLQYVQVAQENELLLVLSLGALVSIRQWESTGAVRWAALAGTACGFAILVRLPSLIETAVFAAFATAGSGNLKRFLMAYLPPVAVAIVVDRWYQWLRFGEWFSTYMGVLARQTQPAFTYPFVKGFFGAFFALDKCIFLFDPLLVVAAMVAIWRWRGLGGRLRTALVSLAALLLLYDAFYARYFDFGGDVAWGHRFLALPVQLLALFAVPLLLQRSGTVPRAVRSACWSLVAFAVLLQALSTTMVPAVEVDQRARGNPHSVIVNRVVNLADAIGGRQNDPRFAGIPAEWRTLTYLPFQLRLRYPRLAVWAIAGWWLLVASIPALVWTILSAPRPGGPARSPGRERRRSPS